MEAEDLVEALEGALLLEDEAAGADLLGLLEGELDGAVEVGAVRREDLGRRQQGADVAVVAAGVVGPDRAGPRRAAVVAQRQGVDVGAQQDRRPLVGAGEGAEQARLTDPDVVDAQRVEAVGDVLRRAELLQARLGVLVKMAAVGDDARGERLDLGVDALLVEDHDSSCSPSPEQRAAPARTNGVLLSSAVQAALLCEAVALGDAEGAPSHTGNCEPL